MILLLGDIVRSGSRHLPECGTFLQYVRCLDRPTDSFVLQSVPYRSFEAVHKFRQCSRGQVPCTSNRPVTAGSLSVLRYSVFAYSGYKRDNNHSLWHIWDCWHVMFQTKLRLLVDYRFSDNR